MTDIDAIREMIKDGIPIEHGHKICEQLLCEIERLRASNAYVIMKAWRCPGCRTWYSEENASCHCERGYKA